MALTVVIQAVILFAAGRDDPAGVVRQLMAGLSLSPAIDGDATVLTLAAATLPSVVFCFLFSSYLSSGIDAEGPIAFSRAGGRAAWALGKVAHVVLLATLHSVGCVLVGFAALFSAGELSQGNVCLMLGVFILTALSVAFFSLAIGCVSLLIDSVPAFVVVTGIHVATLLGCSWGPADVMRAVAPWLPSAQGMLLFHDMGDSLVGSGQGIEGFGVPWSVAYLTLLVTLASVIAVGLTKRRDAI